MWVLLIVAAYLLGTFPSAVLVARASGVDITSVGSGNPGASNVTRALGWRRGAAVFALDALKGIVATGVGLAVAGRPGGYWLGAAAIIGHILPITRPTRGGKGVATGAGMMAVLHPLVVIAGTVLWFALSRLTGRASIASLAVVVGAPVGVALTGRAWWEVVVTTALGLLVIARHADNIVRLVRGSEHRLGADASGSAAEVTDPS